MEADMDLQAYIKTVVTPKVAMDFNQIATGVMSRFMPPAATPAPAPAAPAVPAPVTSAEMMTPAAAPQAPVAPVVPPAPAPAPAATPVPPPPAPKGFGDAFNSYGADLGAKDFGAAAAAPGGLVQNAPGVMKGYHGFDDAAKASPEYQDYMTKNPGAEHGAAMQSLIGSQIQTGMGSQDPTALGHMVGVLTQMSQNGTHGAYATDQLKTLLPQLADRLKALPPEQQEAYRAQFQSAVAKSALPAPLHTALSFAAKAGAGPTPEKFIADEVTRRTVEATKPFVDAAAAVGDQNLSAKSIWDIFSSDNMNWLVPAGIIAMTMFDGKLPKLLGALALGVGGYNLYDRYKAISDPSDPAAQFIATGLKVATDPNGGQKPFSDMNAVRNAVTADIQAKGIPPEKAPAILDRAMRGIQDTHTALRIGMGRKVINAAADRARGVISLIGGDTSAIDPLTAVPAAPKP